jgi:hypothetical protein
VEHFSDPKNKDKDFIDRSYLRLGCGKQYANSSYVMCPWEEVIGTIVGVGLNRVMLSIERGLSIELEGDELERWRHVLKVGRRVSFLKTDDGSVRVRSLRKGKTWSSKSLTGYRE